MKNLLNLGKALNKTEQKTISGGFGRRDLGISDGECNQLQQSQISCNPYGNSNECELDAVCAGTHLDIVTGFYYAGQCSCN